MCRGNRKRDVTTMVTYSHATTPLGQSERAYYLSYFIKFYRQRYASSQWSKCCGLTRRSRVSPQQILTTVMTRIVVDKTIYHAKPHSICFLPQYQRNGTFVLTIEHTDSDLKVHVLHYANELLYASDSFKNFCKLA